MVGEVKTLFITVHAVTGDPEKGKNAATARPLLARLRAQGLSTIRTLDIRTLILTPNAPNRK
jgi:hypothetical protein